MLYTYDETIYGDTKYLSNIVLDIVDDIKTIVNKDTLFDIRLILNELLINCHMHGNKKDCTKSINLNLEIDNKIVYIEVEDEGKSDWERPEYNYLEMKSSGRGLHIVESLVDSIEIENNKIKCKIDIFNTDI